MKYSGGGGTRLTVQQKGHCTAKMHTFTPDVKNSNLCQSEDSLSQNSNPGN